MITITAAAATHPGLRREGNEDALCVRADLGLYVVADGMGGHAAGEVASHMAVAAIETTIRDTKDADLSSTWPFPFDTALSVDGNRLRSAFLFANRDILHAMENDDRLNGMATTAVAMLVRDDRATIAHVGDSRVYRLHGSELSLLTEDHSWVSEQIKSGRLTEADAKRHPWRSVVTKALTGGEDPNADIVGISLEAGDRFLLCSDGLTTVVGHETLRQLLQSGDGDAVCAKLITAANDGGGPDNITVVVIDVKDHA